MYEQIVNLLTQNLHPNESTRDMAYVDALITIAFDAPKTFDTVPESLDKITAYYKLHGDRVPEELDIIRDYHGIVLKDGKHVWRRDERLKSDWATLVIWCTHGLPNDRAFECLWALRHIGEELFGGEVPRDLTHRVSDTVLSNEGERMLDKCYHRIRGALKSKGLWHLSPALTAVMEYLGIEEATCSE